jgi:DNA-binding protein
MSQENTVYIGRKPTMTYVMAVLSSMNNPNTGEVVLKARGRAISTAVDVAEIVRNNYLSNLKPEITVGTESIQNGDQTRNVSSISITLSRMKEVEKPISKNNSDLTNVKGVGAATAKKLRDGGFDSVSKIKSASVCELSESTGLTVKQVEKIKKAAGVTPF